MKDVFIRILRTRVEELVGLGLASVDDKFEFMAIAALLDSRDIDQPVFLPAVNFIADELVRLQAIGPHQREETVRFMIWRKTTQPMFFKLLRGLYVREKNQNNLDAVPYLLAVFVLASRSRQFRNVKILMQYINISMTEPQTAPFLEASRDRTSICEFLCQYFDQLPPEYLDDPTYQRLMLELGIIGQTMLLSILRRMSVGTARSRVFETEWSKLFTAVFC